ncbi:MAG: hypothetical protein AUH78_18130 [Gemmatimonadetes bacterium 13_1_40CM_4_69_8]|nr:MAG: hypothetical protein AUH78_18130 [Gemmatimonadetes bacterium 13_1_40CM_4_69_8]
MIVTGFAVIVAPAGVAAQDGPALIREGIGAYNDFDPQRALPLLRRGVDPKAGPRDSLWAFGVQYLAQILYEQGDEAGARAWIRWAVRLTPGLKLDTLNLLSQVIAEFQSARAATAAGADDARVGTEWLWPSADPGSGPGRIEVRPEGAPAGVTVTVPGHGTVSPRLSLPAGSYEIEARAPGYRPVRFTREVLPGVTTLLAIALQPEVRVAAAGPRPAPGPPPPPVAAKKKGHFPWAVVVLGGLGAGAAAALLGGKGGSGSGGGTSTGGITINIPNP